MLNPKGSTIKTEFLAFVKDSADIDVLKSFVASRGWADTCVLEGDITTATDLLKAHASPTLLLVEIPSAAAAPDLLDKLADVCDPETKVIITGNVNEYSFYCWLMNIGVFSYLLRPLTQAVLETTYQKSIEVVVPGAPKEREPGKVISLIGSRGGVGATTLAINLAGIFSEYANGKKVALVDMDPREGTISLILDIEPSRGLRDVLEKPERIDALFIDRVMNKPNPNLSVLSAEESLQEPLHISENAAEALLKELVGKYDIVVLDIPRYLTQFTRQCLQKSAHVVMVTELSLHGLRDALRLSDLMRDSLKIQPPMVVVNRMGVAPKHEMSVADFEKGMATGTVTESITYTPDVFMQVSNEIPSITHAKHPAMKPLYALAQKLVPDLAVTTEAKKKPMLGFMAKKKKE